MPYRKQKPKQTCRIRWIYIIGDHTRRFSCVHPTIHIYTCIHTSARTHTHLRKKEHVGTRQEVSTHTHIQNTNAHANYTHPHTYTYKNTHKYAHARMHAYKGTHLRNIRSSLRKLQEQCWFFKRREQGVCKILGEILPRVLLLLLHSYLWLVHTLPCRHVVFAHASERTKAFNECTNGLKYNLVIRIPNNAYATQRQHRWRCKCEGLWHVPHSHNQCYAHGRFWCRHAWL